MKFIKTLLASAAVLATFGANANITGSIGGGYGTFLSLSAAGLSGAASATLTGGTVYTADQPFADIPAGVVFEGKFLAAGPSSGAPAVLDFGAGGVDYISFLWGSPDTYNELTITDTLGASQIFTVASFLPPLPGNGDQGLSQYVQFQSDALSNIRYLSFNNIPATDAFESANYTITPIPEPETYALMLAGLGAMGFVARRRKNA